MTRKRLVSAGARSSKKMRVVAESVDQDESRGARAAPIEIVKADAVGRDEAALVRGGILRPFRCQWCGEKEGEGRREPFPVMTVVICHPITLSWPGLYSRVEVCAMGVGLGSVSTGRFCVVTSGSSRRPGRREARRQCP